MAYPTKQTMHVLSTTRVNARTGPGTEFPVLTLVDPSTSLWALGEAKDSHGDLWIAIQKDDGSAAYVKARLLTPDN